MVSLLSHISRPVQLARGGDKLMAECLIVQAVIEVLIEAVTDLLESIFHLTAAVLTEPDDAADEHNLDDVGG